MIQKTSVTSGTLLGYGSVGFVMSFLKLKRAATKGRGPRTRRTPFTGFAAAF
jgi:hypothetical protein